ncbi:hypothetical protein NRB36_004323 [Salmonella enterica]|nr:hypothetical protein [Salmonella enterica]
MANKTGRKVEVNTAAIAECQAAGMSQRATALKLGISTTAVRYHWQGEAGRPAGGPPTGKGDEIRALHAEGVNPAQIAERLEVGIATVYRHIKQATE